MYTIHPKFVSCIITHQNTRKQKQNKTLPLPLNSTVTTDPVSHPWLLHLFLPSQPTYLLDYIS